MCQGFSHFSSFLHDFEIAKLATSRIKVKHTSIAIIGFNLSIRNNVSNHIIQNAPEVYLEILGEIFHRNY